MTITISISSSAEAKLKRDAAASGKDVAQYASELLEQIVAQPDEEQITPENLSPEQWSVRSQAFLAKMAEYARRRPAGHLIDDTRDGI